MPQIAKVAVAAATYAIDKPYDYLIPQGTDIAKTDRNLPLYFHSTNSVCHHDQ